MRRVLEMFRVSRAVLGMIRNANDPDRGFDLIEAMYASTDAAQKAVERMSRDPDAASYVRAHLFETHDLWHVVTGFRPDSAGELGLQEVRAAFGLELDSVDTFLRECEAARLAPVTVQA